MGKESNCISLTILKNAQKASNIYWKYGEKHDISAVSTGGDKRWLRSLHWTSISDGSLVMDSVAFHTSKSAKNI